MDVILEKYEWSQKDAASFASFLKPMLELDPNKRATAAECLQNRNRKRNKSKSNSTKRWITGSNSRRRSWQGLYRIFGIGGYFGFHLINCFHIGCSSCGTEVPTFLVAPFVTTASAPPTPQPHASISTNTARTSPATPTGRRIAPENDLDLVEDLGVALAQIEDPQTPTKNKSHRFFWRKALRRVFQRRK
ncbi:GD15424 [Drosophila simulans]|uniref:non-specific serine/threonine protein kinase n=1 Tax=Drosophila simulans TaxID=7240 RepID=B4NSJ2_DROSI|nr:GD15424 [Drosophila simulans]